MEKIFRAINHYRIFIILFIMVIAASFISPFFLSVENITNIFRASSFIGIVAIGMTMVIILGGIDLSVGSIVGFSGAIAASAWSLTGSVSLVFFIPLALGIVIGLFNGFLVSRLKLQAFVATLATMTIVRGAGLVYTGGQPIYVNYSNFFSFISQSYVWKIPTPALIFVAITFIVDRIIKTRPFGRYLFATGDNETAAALSGINTERIKYIVYALSGFFSAFAGLMLTARMQSGEPGQGGVGWEMDAITAVVLGGTSMNGGSGSVWATLVGAMIIGVINNMFNLLGVEPQWQQVTKGIVIIIAVLLQETGTLNLSGNKKPRVKSA